VHRRIGAPLLRGYAAATPPGIWRRSRPR
jgi:hypothetical protein